MKFDIYSLELAESLFYFVSKPDIYENFIEVIELNGDMSMAEYVDEFKSEEFKQWCKQEYGFQFE